MERTLEELSTLQKVSKGHEANQELDALLPELIKQVRSSLEEIEGF
jgi:cell fate (sporulation/competence/biofilm development) regulator YlbF (YheA/YmcA/DUF963 family)